MKLRRYFAITVFFCCVWKGAKAVLSFNPEPNQAVNATVEATDTVSTTASGGGWALNWLFDNTVVAAVDIDITSGAVNPRLLGTVYDSRIMVRATPVVAGVFLNYTTVLTIRQVRLTDTFAIRAELSGGTTNPDSKMLSVKECNDTFQTLNPSNTAIFMGTTTFKCIGANSVSLIGACQANATWSISGSCPAVQCNTTAATDSTNGIILTNSALLNTLVNVGAIVNVGCGDGFNGTGGSRTCQADGTWSAQISCARVCNTAAVVSNGICLLNSATPNSVAVGTVVSLTCCVGYIPNNGSGTCANDGSWNTALVCTPNVTTTDTTPIFNNNTTGTSQPTTTTGILAS
ncbi:uncharacterized protein LOC104266756 isoform X2 [Ciona intestinalis]